MADTEILASHLLRISTEFAVIAASENHHTDGSLDLANRFVHGHCFAVTANFSLSPDLHTMGWSYECPQPRFEI